jgi:endogenous inhibitor of DNA gyrase (YacG/DUF329 family)
MNCPVCGKKSAPEHKPFCSARCAQIDLGRWLREDYKLPAPPEPDEAGDEAAGGET